MSYKFEMVKCNFNESSTKVSYIFTVAMFSPMFTTKTSLRCRCFR